MSRFTPIPIELIQEALDSFPMVDDICPECEGEGTTNTSHGIVDCFLCTDGVCEVGRFDRVMTGHEMVAFALFMALEWGADDDDEDGCTCEFDADECNCPYGLDPPDEDGEEWKKA